MPPPHSHIITLGTTLSHLPKDPVPVAAPCVLSPLRAVLATSTNHSPGSPHFPSTRDIFFQPPFAWPTSQRCPHTLSLLAPLPSQPLPLQTPTPSLLQKCPYKGPNCLRVSVWSYSHSLRPAALWPTSSLLQQAPWCGVAASQRPHSPSLLLLAPWLPHLGLLSWILLLHLASGWSHLRHLYANDTQPRGPHLSRGLLSQPLNVNLSPAGFLDSPKPCSQPPRNHLFVMTPPPT